MRLLEFGKSEILLKGKDIAILAVGNMVDPALKAAKLLGKDNIGAEVINVRFVKPIDEEMIESIYAKFSKIITIEDGQVNGGYGTAVLEFINKRNYTDTKLLVHGIPDRFIEHGTREELYKMLKLDELGIYNVVRDFISISE
jgi:1-deoxy-D-xylulose-5-phosphate synthase